MRISRLFLSKIGRKSLVPADRKEFIMKIVVLAGGISTERDVSLVSGMGIYKALKSKGHQVMLLDVFLGYEHDDWKDVFEKNVDWAASVGAIKDQNPDIDAVKALRPDWKKNFFGPHVIEICQHADVVFMADKLKYELPDT